MKLILLCIAFFLALSPSFSQSSADYKIIGNINELPSGTMLYLIRNDDAGNIDTISGVKSFNGRFTFTGLLKHLGETHYILLDTTSTKLKKGAQTWIRLIMENSMIKLTGKMNEWPKVRIEGSPATKEYDMFYVLFDSMAIKHRAESGSGIMDASRIAKTHAKDNEFLVSYFETHTDSYATPLLLMNSTSLSPDQKKSAFEKLSSRMQESYYGLKIRKQIIDLDLRTKVRRGAIIPDFEVLTEKNEAKSIRELIKNSRYTLIDFWASWCKPCRAEIPNLKEVYNKFSNEGFNIIGLSIDQDNQSWRKAIYEDKTPWIHILDKDNKARGIFDFKSIPAYILVDSTGEMLSLQCAMSSISSFGDKIRGEDLKETLFKLLNQAKNSSGGISLSK